MAASLSVKIQLVPDVLAGVVDRWFDPPANGVQHVQSGKLRALAIASRSRLPALPEVPTMAEAGLPDFYTSTWFEPLAAGELPVELRKKLRRDVAAVVGSPAFTKVCEDRCMRAMAGTSEDAAKFMAHETETLRAVIKAAPHQNGLNQSTGHDGRLSEEGDHHAEIGKLQRGLTPTARARAS